MKQFWTVIGIILLFILLIFAANEFEIFGTRFWGVRHENARREVFENTQSYVEGKRQDLVKYHHEWMQAKDPNDKKIIENTIRHDFSNFDIEKIKDPDLYQFLYKIMHE